MDSPETLQSWPMAPLEPPTNDTNRLASLPRELLDSIMEFVIFSSINVCGDHRSDETSDWETVDSGDEATTESSNANLYHPSDEEKEHAKKAVLLSVSRVCKKLRDVCLPKLFRSLKIVCDEDGFKKLAHMSSSNLAPLVREFIYCVPYLYDPRVKDRDVLENEIYSQDDDNRARGDWLKWEMSGGTYTNLLNQTINMCHEQYALLNSRIDRHSVATGVPRLSNLDTFHLVMTETIDPVLEHFAEGWKRRVLHFRPASSHHMFVCMEALRAATSAGVEVKTFRCEGNMFVSPLEKYAESGCTCGCESEKDEQIQPPAIFSGLSNMELIYQYHYGEYSGEDIEINLPSYGLNLSTTSQTLKSLILDGADFEARLTVFKTEWTDIFLPSLQELSLRSIWLGIDGFESFLVNRAPNLSVLRLYQIWKWDCSKTHQYFPGSRRAEYLPGYLECLERIGNAVRLKEVRVYDDDFEDRADQSTPEDILGGQIFKNKTFRLNRPVRVMAFERVLLREFRSCEAMELVRIKPRL